MNQSDTIISDSLLTDSAATDSVSATQYALLISPPEKSLKQGIPKTQIPTATSWVLAAVILLFCLVCFKFRKNLKYIRLLVTELTDTRERGNMFDDTARETFFMFLLNLLFCVSSGIMLYYAASGEALSPLSFSGSKLALCCALTAGWELLLLAVYSISGFTFFSRSSTSLWIRGFIANQGLLALALTLPSILLLFHPAWTAGILILCISLFTIARIMFIWRGLRIFFSQNNSLLLFLCYLCSLEIVPILITYEAAKALCS